MPKILTEKELKERVYQIVPIVKSNPSIDSIDPNDHPRQYLLANLPPQADESGMFSVMIYILGILHEFESKNYGGIEIDFGNIGKSYYDPNRGPNWWNYYFNPLKIGETKDKIVLRQSWDDYHRFNTNIELNFKNNGKGIDRASAHEIIRKYVSVNSDMQRKIDQFIKDHFQNHYVIGVHYRGTDKGSEAPKTPYENMIKLIQAHIDDKKLEDKNFKIFIASDEQDFIDFAKLNFGDHVITSDVQRSTNGKALHLDRENNKDPYKNGEGALLDCHLLARGDVLIRTSSNLSLFSTYINPIMKVIEASARHGQEIANPRETGNPTQPIVTLNLGGGTGNQLFQAATALSHALDIGGIAMFPDTTVDHVGKSPLLSKIRRFQGNLFPHSFRLQEENKQFLQIPKDSRSIHLEGYFFSAKYFDHHRSEILETFAPSLEVREALQTKYKDLLSQDTVAVHIRRGDYKTTYQDGKRLLCDLSEDTDYYTKAIEHFDKESQHFVIFSDDIEYAKNMPALKNLKHVTYIEGQKAHEDLYLMSMCKNQIMANSTFSWWAAYLREHPNQKVTYPINAFWGPSVTQNERAFSETGWWGEPIAKNDVDPKGICSRGPDYFPMDHWIKVT